MIRNAPLLSLVASRDKWVVSSVTVIRAFGTIAPEGSDTVPTRSEVMRCAKAPETNQSADSTHAAKKHREFISTSCLHRATWLTPEQTRVEWVCRRSCPAFLLREAKFALGWMASQVLSYGPSDRFTDAGEAPSYSHHSRKRGEARSHLGPNSELSVVHTDHDHEDL